MDAPTLTLASASPRRRRLLAWLELPYGTMATDTDEDLTGPLRRVPPVLARTLAADKARAARATGAPGTILACDTIVVLDGEVLGKPVDRDDARRMLSALSGRMHEVVTGVALLAPADAEPLTFAVSTPVVMRDLSDGSAEEWLAGDEVLGCAGAYNIERMLASVQPDECFQNVAGLPLCHLCARLRRHGVDAASPVAACDASRGVTCALGPRICGA